MAEPVDRREQEQRRCVTKPRIASVSYTWTLKQFSLYALNTRTTTNLDYIESTYFSSSSIENAKWCLHLYPTGNSHDAQSVGYVSIYVRPILTEGSKVVATYKLSVLSRNEMRTFSKHCDTATYYHSSPIRGWPQFVKMEDLRNRASDLIPNDTLTIIFDLTLMESFETFDDTPTAKIPECRLGDDLSNLLACGAFSDVALMASGKKFNVHKAILAGRSSVFAAMFSVEMREKDAAVIPLPDIDSETLNALLTFMYTGETMALMSVYQACKLLVAADKYDLDRLKKMCENMMCSKISVENVSQLLTFANTHNADQLEHKATHFMQMHISEVQKTEGWRSLFHNHPCQLPRGELPDVVNHAQTNS